MATSRRINGATPNGGSYAIITFVNDDGDLAEQAVATRFELVEYDKEDDMVFRTYGPMTDAMRKDATNVPVQP